MVRGKVRALVVRGDRGHKLVMRFWQSIVSSQPSRDGSKPSNG